MGISRKSVAFDLAHVACGIFDGYFELSLKPWDIAAGALGEWIGLVALIALCLYVVVYSRQAKGEA